MFFFIKVGAQGRHFITFGVMILQKTDRLPTDYLAYGCYCGADRYSNVFTPLDATDQCCQAHDACYDLIRSPTVPRPSEVIYTFDIKQDNILCTNANKSSVEYKTCLCDKIAAECFGNATTSFNKNYQGYDVKLCK